MGKIIITERHLIRHKVKSGVLHLEFRSGMRISLISKLGFSMKRDRNKVRLHNLQPLAGFNMNPSRMEFREKLREGLMVSYYQENERVEIVIQDLNREDVQLAFRKDEE
jgi:hypothetical protein